MSQSADTSRHIAAYGPTNADDQYMNEQCSGERGFVDSTYPKMSLKGSRDQRKEFLSNEIGIPIVLTIWLQLLSETKYAGKVSLADPSRSARDCCTSKHKNISEGSNDVSHGVMQCQEQTALRHEEVMAAPRSFAVSSISAIRRALSRASPGRCCSCRMQWSKDQEISALAVEAAMQRTITKEELEFDPENDTSCEIDSSEERESSDDGEVVLVSL